MREDGSLNWLLATPYFRTCTKPYLTSTVVPLFSTPGFLFLFATFLVGAYWKVCK